MAKPERMGGQADGWRVTMMRHGEEAEEAEANQADGPGPVSGSATLARVGGVA